ncbi:cysteine--tRNA ligase 2, cytoplasmic-like protein [Tanacetum coccineum]
MVEGQVSLYVCGITTYDYSHMGHGRAYVSFDLFHRADEHECDPLELSTEFCYEFLTDMANLQCLPPTVQPRVSDHMDQIKNMIAKIIKNGSGERIVIDPRKKNPADFALWKPDAIVTTPTNTIRPSQPAISPVEQEVAAAVESMEKATRYTLNKYVEAALNSATIVLPYLVPASCFSSLYLYDITLMLPI